MADELALPEHWLAVPNGAEAGDMRLRGLGLAVLGGLAEENVEIKLDTVPVYVRVRRSLMRRGVIDADTVPMWPAVDW
jgi:hypothetical protein